jgi:hypothetical protein
MAIQLIIRISVKSIFDDFRHPFDGRSSDGMAADDDRWIAVTCRPLACDLHVVSRRPHRLMRHGEVMRCAHAGGTHDGCDGVPSLPTVIR